MRLGLLVMGIMIVSAILAGCSEKQFNDNANSITNDISNFGKKVTEQH